MDSSKIHQLFSHHIQHPKVQAVMHKYQITKYWPEYNNHDYCNHEYTMSLRFSNGKTYNKIRYAPPLIDRFGNPLAANEIPKGRNHLFLTSISYSPGFNGKLPFGLMLDMNDAAISQILQTKPIGTREHSLQVLENGITCVKWHIFPHFLLYVLHQGFKPYVFQFSLIENWQIERYNLYADYPDYVKGKPLYHCFKFWRSK